MWHGVCQNFSALTDWQLEAGRVGFVIVAIDFHLNRDFTAGIDQPVGLLGADAAGPDGGFLGVAGGAGRVGGSHHPSPIDDLEIIG